MYTSLDRETDFLLFVRTNLRKVQLSERKSDQRQYGTCTYASKIIVQYTPQASTTIHFFLYFVLTGQPA